MRKIKKIFKIKKRHVSYSFSELLIVTLVVSLVISSVVGFVVFKIVGNTSLLKVEATYDKIKNEYYKSFNKDELESAAIDGMMSYLNEKYSSYLKADETTNLDSKLEGSYEGIGIEISKIDEKIKIVNVYENTPASVAGLKSGDIIVKIDDIKIDASSSIETVLSLVKDKKEINISVKRDDEEKNFKVAIKTIEKPVVTRKVFTKNGKKVGYIYLSSFTENSANQVKTALKELDNEKIDSLIFDVRSNTGGYLTSVTDILNMFLKKGHVLYSLEEKNKKQTYYDTTKEEYDKDVVVLIDRKTASASEILASSLKESYGAIVVGTT
ncbi:PDZ domain-containing protein, partial [bacterium]|nr:PDZ domain-containing protein [bacterium]